MNLDPPTSSVGGSPKLVELRKKSPKLVELRKIVRNIRETVLKLGELRIARRRREI